MKHLIRLAALMTAAVVFALPLGAQSRGHSSGHGSASHSSASSSYSHSSGPSHSSSSPSRSGSSASIGSSHHSSSAGRSIDRPAGGHSVNRSTGSVSHSNGGSSTHPSGDRQRHSGSSADRPATGSHGGSVATRPSHDGATAHRPSGSVANRPSHEGNRPSADAHRPSGHSGSAHRPSGHVPPRPAPGARPYADGHRPAPAHMGRVHVNHNPGHRAPRPMHHRELSGRPIRFSHFGHHGYGRYVLAPPARYIHRIYHGIDYYFWDDIWYRYYAGRYWVCRPPFGYVFTPLADAAFTAIALNALTEETSAPVAKSLNLVRSYAAAGTEYFYNDGVFYVKGEDGQYIVIVPPAGALVDTLPEDYEEFEFEGNTYYKVDDTVYQMTVTEDGRACFEVLGQLAK